MTSTLLALSQLASTAATAPAPEKKTEDEGTALPQLVVQADGTKKLYKPENLTTQKYTVPLRDVPQTVTVIPKEVMQEQGVSNLRDVLKNVPGISMQAGEGGVPPGDNLAIRGFNARTDLFVDGVRDFGGYSRDPFNVEQVEVTKGPSSTNAGRGSTGGSINLSSKMPHLENAYGLMLGGGSDGFLRSAFDVNQEIPTLKGAAVRLNGVYHSQDTPGRDHVEQERWGVAPSISFGLGTETRFTLSYFHLEQNNTPDYGLPWVPRDNPLTPENENITGLSSGQTRADDNNWYGLLGRDRENTKTDIITGIFEHDFNENLKLKNTTRLGQNEIDLIVTAPRFFTDSNPATPTRNPLPPGVDPTSVRRTDWKNRDQKDTIISNQTDLRYDFETGTVKHELVASLEYAHEESENRTRDDLNAAALPIANLGNPDPTTSYVSDFVYNDGVNETTADTFALSLFDTVKINEQWMVTGGLRWESFDVDYTSRAPTVAGVPGLVTDLDRKDEMLSYRAAITYKPVQTGSIYLGYGTSFNPAAEGLALSDSTTAANNVETDPEENQTIELGTKWDFLDEKLSLTGAIFRTDKTNARTEDPADPADVITLDGEQSVQGFEVGFTGLITEQWRIIGGYTYLDSEIKSSNNAFEEGNEISNTPENSFSLWTVHDLPAGFQVGVGTQYVGSRYNNANDTTRQQAPSYTVFDAMVGYKLNENVSFRLNAYNLGDKDYIDRVGGGHYVPGQGRSVVLTADIKF
jgi:catecholate siderophore receptor